MSTGKTLLAVAIGPVQEFIAAGRRTRDLWAGSQMLSEISKAAALEVAKWGRLIFPGGSAESPIEKARGVANIVVAELNEGAAADQVARAAREAAHQKWKGFAGVALARFPKNVSFIHRDLFEEQMEGVLEFYAAWTPLTGNYQESRKRVMQLLGGRKACRNFEQSKFQRRNFPKSSLDGLRESVLTEKGQELGGEETERYRRLQRDMRLRPGEHLDVIGITKRLSDLEYFPSVSRIAAGPWLRGNQKDKEFGELKEQCGKIGSYALVAAKWPQFLEFPFDGTVVYRNRHKEIENYGLDEGESRALVAIGQILKRRKWEPQPYVGILAADGDRIGQMISEMKSAEDHREFSLTLAGFAAAARKIVEEEGSGCLIYSGGDDVLALVPVDQILPTSRKLHDKFGEILERYNIGREKNKQATLSVGVAIGHFLEPLEDLLQYARAAEKAAKGKERNGFAIAFHPRSGAAMTVRQSWSGDFPGLLDTFTDWHVTDKIPDKAAYDLLRLAASYKDWPEETRKAAFRDDAIRLLSRKRGAGRDEHKEQLKDLESRVAEMLDLPGSGPEFLAQCLAITRRIAQAVKEAGGGQKA